MTLNIQNSLGRLSGTPAEAGVRGFQKGYIGAITGLSGTPAEAGVRDCRHGK